MGKEDRKRLYTNIKVRDGYHCQMCGGREVITIHHIIPRSWGGRDEVDNLVVLCWECHQNTHRAYTSGLCGPGTFWEYLRAMRSTYDYREEQDHGAA